MLRGYDISGWQSASIQLETDFVFVKATEGKDRKFSTFSPQFTMAKKNAKVRGAYHFARPEESSGTAQADFFLSVAGGSLTDDDLLILDLEASELDQAGTHKFAVDFANRLKAKRPNNRRVIYMGSGYARNNTGRGLKDYYHLWWYPQYKTAANVTKWPGSFAPWLPAGLTCGWSRPDIWQFSGNFGSKALDANVTDRTVEQLLGHVVTDPTPAPKPDQLEVDGELGAKTIRALQRALKVTADGELGPLTIKALQKHLGVTADGELGPKTIRALQKKVGATQDGELGPKTIKALQRALNEGRL